MHLQVAADSPVILYLHGGGFSAGSPETYRMFAGQLSRATGFRVLLVDYKLAPEHQLEAGIASRVEAPHAELLVQVWQTVSLRTSGF